MAYGALLTDANGVPFYIADTMPVSLTQKISYNVSAGLSSRVLFANDGVLRMVFVGNNAAQANSSSCEYLQLENNNWILYSSGAARTIDVYIFGYNYQPVPSWGIQINDDQGRCILTNETKVLRDVQALGNPSSDTASGYKINQTLSGHWAVAPQNTGLYTAVANTNGQPIPVQAWYYATARWNGSTTQITSGYRGDASGGTSNQTYINSRSRITAINVDRY
ncbi:hypothetical protein Q3V30_12740 [Erwinia pyri]|uniref:Uncharacterized protein n=1 Tax=Erwinia pyri TaxID=3062598 RepID=A0AA50DJW6_9GAMM|nr:hypothetical protein [Erwinia sp. DE2]WLS77355.1 hypothetical protein Q3V30_12740 [Erwinia sp. DE2]